MTAVVAVVVVNIVPDMQTHFLAEGVVVGIAVWVVVAVDFEAVAVLGQVVGIEVEE